jgi:hypothetical protein
MDSCLCQVFTRTPGEIAKDPNVDISQCWKDIDSVSCKSKIGREGSEHLLQPPCPLPPEDGACG